MKSENELKNRCKESDTTLDYSYPLGETKEAIEDCKSRVANGKRCYCLQVCTCRECQECSKKNNDELCDLCYNESGCFLGCHKCSDGVSCK